MSGSQDTFESVAEAERRAKKYLPHMLYAAVKGGVEQGLSRDDNAAAFRELRVVPAIGTGISGPRDQTTTVLGVPISLPVVLAPTGAQGSIRPEGELATARASAAAGTAMGLSSFASTAVEDVVQVNPDLFFQMFWLGSREQMAATVQRAHAAGAKALILTLDYVFAHRRDWGTPVSPAHVDNPSKLYLARQFGQDAIKSPRWLSAFLRERTLPAADVPNVGTPGQPAPPFLGAFIEWAQTPAPTWADIGWLREQWDGPFVVKGIARPEDARRAVDLGASAVSVSNYGGSNLDGTPATIRLLPPIVDAVGGQIEVLLDGGVQRGSDVVKAVALGARAVMVGRSFLWGLAVNGEAGVTNVLDILRAGIDETLVGLGRASVQELVPEDILVPAGFAAEMASGGAGVVR